MSDIPSRLGRYEIVGILGQGAMGVVYEGLDSVIDRRVAIKTIRTADLDTEDDAEPARRFMIEARAAGKLNHPHIVSLYDHGNDEGTVYLVLELVSGRELQRHIEGGARFGFADTLRLMGELLSALGYSHRQGVVHRDVKPANIFITEEGSVKLGDFGIARLEASQRTRVGTLLGTPSHMAPEQIRGEAADARSDLYAAGVVLYELLTGRRPFTGPMLKLAMKVLNEEPPPPSTFVPELPAAVDAVVVRALAKAPAERYQSAVEFWQALASALGPLAATDRAGPHAGSGGHALMTGSSSFATHGFGTLPWSAAAPATATGGKAITATAVMASATATAAEAASSLRLAPTAEPTSTLQPSPGSLPATRSTSPPAPPPRAASAAVPASVPSTPAITPGLPRSNGRRSTRMLTVAAVGLAVVVAAAWMAIDRDLQPSAPEAAVQSAPVVRSAPGEDVPPPIESGKAGITPGADQSSANAPAVPAPSAAEKPAPATEQPPAPDPVLASPTPTLPPRSSPATAAAPVAPAAATTRTAAAPKARREPARTGTAAASPEAATPSAVAPAPVQKPARCSDILLKASLEPLSDEEGSFLRRECR